MAKRRNPWELAATLSVIAGCLVACVLFVCGEPSRSFDAFAWGHVAAYLCMRAAMWYERRPHDRMAEVPAEDAEG